MLQECLERVRGCKLGEPCRCVSSSDQIPLLQQRREAWPHLLDRVAAVPQNALGAVDEADAGDDGRSVHVAGVVHPQADAIAASLDLVQVPAPDGAAC